METKKSNNGFPIPFQALYKIWEFFFGFPYLSQLPSLDDDVDCLTIEFGRFFYENDSLSQLLNFIFVAIIRRVQNNT